MINNKTYNGNIFNITNSNVIKLKDLKELLNKFSKYSDNNESKIIEKVTSFIKSKNQKHKIYFKLSWDKSNNLIAIYFDIDSFLEVGTETVWLFTSDKFNEMSFLQLSFWNIDSQYFKNYRSNVSHVNIDEFRSFILRKGHGSYMLSSLDIIIKEVNNQITFNKNELYPIRTITGTVIPMEKIIKLDDLNKFYISHGYFLINQRLDNGKFKNIILKQVN